MCMHTRCGVPAVLLAFAGAALAQPDAGAAGGPVGRYDEHLLVRVHLKAVRDLQTTLALTDDVWSHHVQLGGSIDVRMRPDQYAALVEAGVNHQVLIADLQRLVDAEAADIRARRLQDGLGFYENFRTYDEIKAYCQQLAAEHPQLAEYIVLGHSLQNREIFGLRIYSPGGPAQRPAAIYFACQHAREWATPPTAVYLAEMLLEQHSTQWRVRHLVDNVEFFIVPIVNPDGYSYTWTNQRFWRKNLAPAPAGSSCIGVDLNRNWGHQWGGAGGDPSPCSETYRGSAPFSEPETRVIRDFVAARPNIAVALDIHSYGQMLMFPWAYTNQQSPHHQWFLGTSQAARTAIQSAYGRLYAVGPIYSTLYPAAGCSTDWFYGAQGIRAWITEVRSDGGGFALPASSIIPNAEENYRGEIVLAQSMAPPLPCYANCDLSTASPVLNIADFACFIDRFTTAHPYANCDASTLPPVLNVADFACFLQQFAAGCP